MAFPEHNFWCATCSPEFQHLSWHLDIIHLVKGQCTIYRLEYIFRKKPGNRVDKIIDQLHLSKSISNEIFKFICQMQPWVIAICTCAEILNFQYIGIKRFLSKLGSKLPNLV